MQATPTLSTLRSMDRLPALDQTGRSSPQPLPAQWLAFVGGGAQTVQPLGAEAPKRGW